MFLVPVSRRAAVRTHGFDRLFDEAFDRFLGHAGLADTDAARRPALDVAESDAAYVVTLDVPGVAREDVKVSIEGRRVSIAAQARAPQAEAAAATEGAAEAPKPAEPRLLLRERAAASYARSLVLPAEIDQSASQAKLDNGVLTLTLAKRSPATAQLAVN
ncbi:MAG: Hsp20/alpha crystallin family protein [Burkholderiaceae bacterium]